VTGGRDMTLREAEPVPQYLHTKIDPNANVMSKILAVRLQ